MGLENMLQMPMSMHGADLKGASDKLDVRALSGKGHGTVEERRTALRQACLLYTSPSPRDATLSRMPSSA